jgi:hypothetical protein
MIEAALAQWEARQTERQAPEAQDTPAQAAAGIRELRQGNTLPAGEPIKDFINRGRA